MPGFNRLNGWVPSGRLLGAFKPDDMEDEDMPVGVFLPFGGSSPPDGWLMCDGEAVSRETYSDLFAVLGVAWGSGDGSTTFNVPDMRGRTSVGAGQGSGLTNREVASQFGTETHQLTAAQMPSHEHNVAISHSDTTGTDTAHYRTARTTPSFGTPTSSEGNDQPHNNMQPSLAANWIIKATE